MTRTTIELTGTLQADGTLVLDEKPALPPGRVRVVLETVPEPAEKEDWWAAMQRARREMEAAGLPFMNEEELNAHVEWLREGDRIDEMLQQADEKP